MIALLKLDPFDYRAPGSFAQGDRSWEDFLAFDCGSKMLPLQKITTIFRLLYGFRLRENNLV